MTSPEVIKSLQEERSKAEDPASKHASNDSSSPSSSMRSIPAVEPNDFAGRTFLFDKEGSQRLRFRIVKHLNDLEGDLGRDSSRLKIFYATSDDATEEIFAHNESLEQINNSQQDDLIECKFK